MYLKLIEWEGVHWIDLAQAMNKWRALVNTVTNKITRRTALNAHTVYKLILILPLHTNSFNDVF